MVGGGSRRFGTPKSEIRIDGATLLERSVALLEAALGTEPLVVGGSAIPDTRPGCGPLAGLESAFHNAGADALIVVACDMPGLSSTMINLLASHKGLEQVVVPRLGDRLHPLCARWHRDALAQISLALDEGRHSVTDLLSRLDVYTLDEQSLRNAGVLPERELFNVNRPEDLRAFLDSQIS